MLMSAGSATSIVLVSLLAAQQGPEIAQVDSASVEAETTATIIVTGTRIQTPNRKSASPVETVRPEDFILSGVPNVEQTLNQLPQIIPSFTNTSNNPGTGAATLDLRGLGSVRTLLLVNGRRWIANDAGQIPEIDVNTIPAALIDRVDIVTGGASAVYGSDAVTGVINFVLKRQLDGLHLEMRTNITERGDASSLSADLSYGTRFLDERGNALVSIGWLKQEPTFQGDRDFSRFSLGDGCVIKGTRDRFGASESAGNFDCVAPNEEWGLIRLGSPTIPQSRIASGVLIPTGTGPVLQRFGGPRFEPGGSIVPFFAPTDSFNFAPDNYLQVPLERISGNVLASFKVSAAIEPYTELSFIRTRSPQQLASAPASIGTGSDSVFPARLNLDNPFLSAQGRQVLDINFGIDAEGDRGFVGSPAAGFSINPAFGGDADGIVTLPSRGISSRLTGLGPRRIESERKAYRGLIGLRGELSPRWSYDFYYSHSHVSHDTEYFNSASARRLQQALLARTDSMTGEVVCIDPSDGCVPINIFGQQDISPEAAEFLRIDPIERTRVEEQIAEALFKGDLFELPAGTLKTALGIGWRRTSYKFMPDLSFEEGDTLGFLRSTGAAGSTRVFEVFGEALVPILEARPFADELSAELGLRYSDYDSVGGVWTWKAMGNWAPIRQLRFRAGLQQAIRAPNARELYEESTANFGFVLDPCAPVDGFVQTPEVIAACARNGAANLPDDFYSSIVHTGGSTDLEAETARTLTIGAVFQPIPGLNATIDYYDINIKDAIGVFGGGSAYVVVGCIFGGADPGDPLCQAFERGSDGFVADVFTPSANLGRLRTRGVDWQLDYGFPLLSGRLSFNLSGTRLIKSDVLFNPGLEPLRCAGSFGFPCGNTIQGVATPKWKLFNRASWNAGPATLSLRHRYFSSTRDARIAEAEALGQPEPFAIPVNARIMKSRHYFDAALAFDIAQRFELTVGINNLTDAKPFLVGGQQVQANTDPSLYDVLGRRFFATVRAKIR